MKTKHTEAPEFKGIVTIDTNKNTPMVSSLVIAEHFEKLHKDVLKAIQNLELPEDFSGRNFAPANYTDAQGKNRPAVNMTRDGFSMLAMGFTGKKAMEWKVKFLEAFNMMEQKLTLPMVDAPITYRKADDRELMIVHGLTQYLGFLEGVSYEEAKSYVEKVSRVNDLNNMDASGVDAAWTYLQICTDLCPRKDLEGPVCTPEKIAILSGLIDLWSDCSGHKREKLEKEFLGIAYIDSMEQIPERYFLKAVSVLWGKYQYSIGYQAAQN
jgi:Rha family phage regulatory protein